MSRIAMVAALEREVRPLVRGWRAVEREVSGRRFRFFENEGAVLVCGGMGAESARRGAEAIMNQYRPDIVYSVGYAGALDSALKVGDVVRPGRVVNAGDGSSVVVAGGTGVLVSYGSVASRSQKSKLRESYGADSVDMEASAVARAAEARGAELAVLKVISDEYDFEFPAMDRFVNSEGKFQELRFALFAAVRPWLWARLMRLAGNSQRASRVLSEELRKIILAHSTAEQSTTKRTKDHEGVL